MRILIGLVVLAALAYVGFQTFRTDEGRQTLEETARQAAATAQEAAGQAATAARQAAQVAGEAAREVTQEAGELAGRAGDAAGEATRQAGEVVRDAGQAAQGAGQPAALTVGDVDVGAELRGFVDRTRDTLANVRDQASAEAALPSLQDTRSKLDGLAAQVEQLPAEGRAQLANAVNASLPTLKDLAGRLAGTEGGQTLKPTLDAMIARLEGWAKAPA